MPSHEHNKLAQHITSLDTRPDDPSKYATWIKAVGHLDLLRNNVKKDELVVCAIDRRTLIQAVVVTEDVIQNVSHDQLLNWSGNPCSPCASYFDNNSGDEKICRDDVLWHHESLSDAKSLVFFRKLTNSKDDLYCEILQEYSHVADIHWCPERHAYCRFESGDLEDVVSITCNGDDAVLDLVTFKRLHLERFLRASNSVLVRMFEFALQPLNDLWEWEAEIEPVSDDANLFYRRRFESGKAGYYRGVQIIRPSFT